VGGEHMEWPFQIIWLESKKKGFAFLKYQLLLNANIIS
jgi:hypothetical protein